MGLFFTLAHPPALILCLYYHAIYEYDLIIPMIKILLILFLFSILWVDVYIGLKTPTPTPRYIYCRFKDEAHFTIAGRKVMDITSILEKSLTARIAKTSTTEHFYISETSFINSQPAGKFRSESSLIIHYTHERHLQQ